MNDSSFNLIAETPHLLVVAKPAGLPTVPLAQGTRQKTLLSEVGIYFREVLVSMGEHGYEGGVIHRLDTETCGLVLIARDLITFNTLRQAQKSDHFEKTYIAATRSSVAIEGFPPFLGEAKKDLVLESRFRAYGEGRKAVRPVTLSSPISAQNKGGSVTYRTIIELIGTNSEGAELYRCRLHRGFRHQVRSHLAWSSHPIEGDLLYGGKPSGCLHLAAVKLGFIDPESRAWSEYLWSDPPEWTVVVENSIITR